MKVNLIMNFVADKWYELNENSCRLIYDEAKARFEEFASESESITDKSVKILTATVAVATFLIGFVLSHRLTSLGWIPLTAIVFLFVWQLNTLFLLIAPKEVRFRGVDVHTSFRPDIVHPENKDCQIQATYFTVIKALKENADVMLSLNISRASTYKTALFLLFGIIVLVGVYVGVTLSLS